MRGFGLARFIVVVVLIGFAGAHAAAQAPLPPYLLTPEERAALRQSVGSPTDRVLDDQKPLEDGLDRAFLFAAEPYDKTLVYNPGPARTLLGSIAYDPRVRAEPGSGSPLVLERDRFVGGSLLRCPEGHCEGWAAFVADLKTGHMVTAIFDEDVDPGTRDQGVLMVFSVACANPELNAAARPLIDRFAADKLKRSIQWAPTTPVAAKPASWKVTPIITSCEGKLVSPLPPKPVPIAMPSSKNRPAGVDIAEPFRLTPAELSRLRSLADKKLATIQRDKEIWAALSRVFIDLAGKSRVGEGSKKPFIRVFSDFLSRPASVKIEDNRLEAMGFAPRGSKGGKGMFVVDLADGHVVAAAVLDEVWVAQKACVGSVLSDAATAWFKKWAYGGEGPLHVAATPCASK